MPSIQLPNQIFNVSAVTYATVTVTATSSSSLSNLYPGLVGYIVGAAGTPVSKRCIITEVISSGVIKIKYALFEGEGQPGIGYDFTDYNGGTIYFEAQLATVSDNSGLASGSAPGQMSPDLYTLCTTLQTDYNAGKRMYTAASALVAGAMSTDHFSLCAALKTPYDAGARLISSIQSTAVDNLITYGNYLSTANVPEFVAGAASIAPATDKASCYLIASTVTLSAPATLTIATTNTPLQGNYIIVCRALALGQTLSVANGGVGGGTLGTFPASMTVPRGLMVWFDGTNFIFNGYCWIRA
jgi:hypothetical protein